MNRSDCTEVHRIPYAGTNQFKLKGIISASLQAPLFVGAKVYKF